MEATKDKDTPSSLNYRRIASRGCAIVVTCLLLSGAIFAFWLWKVATAPSVLKLCAAIRRDDLEYVRDCLDDGFDVNQQSRWGWNKENLGESPLICAAKVGNLRIAKFLLERGADVDLGFGEKEYGQTPLDEAVIRGDVEMARHLLDAGANPNASSNRPDVSPLFWAVQEEHWEIARLLVQRGSSPTVEDYAKLLSSRKTTENVLPKVEFLVESGLDVNARDSYGKSLLSYAARDLPEVADWLRSQGADEQPRKQ